MLPPITVIIGHCHPEFGIILRNIIRSHHRLSLVAIASTAAELLQLAVAYLPDVIIADVALPGMDGLNLMACVAAIRQPAQFVFSWHYDHELLLRPLIAMAPVSYIVQDAAPAEYDIAIRQTMQGTPYHCAQTKKLMDNLTTSATNARLAYTPGKKYRFLLYCEVLGFNCKETAIATELTEQSVRTYRTRYKKMLGSRGFEVLIRALERNDDNPLPDP